MTLRATVGQQDSGKPSQGPGRRRRHAQKARGRGDRSSQQGTEGIAELENSGKVTNAQRLAWERPGETEGVSVSSREGGIEHEALRDRVHQLPKGQRVRP